MPKFVSIEEAVKLIPDGATVIKPGDHVVIMAAAGSIKSLNEIVEGF